jgi:RNA-binding protein
MAELTGTQRKYLRGLAHELEPVVRVGQKGLTQEVEREVDRALTHHELVKVKLAGDRDERRRVAAELCRGLRAELVGAIGTMAILFRRHPEPKERKIRLP